MIYCIYGCDEEWLIAKEINKAIKENIEDINDFNVVTYTYSKNEIDNIVRDCHAVSFFNDKKAVVVKECSFLNSIEEDNELIEYIKNPIDSTVLILTYSGLVNEKLPIVSYLRDNARMQKIKEIEPKEWPVVINQFLNKHNINIEDDAREEFVNRTSGDLNRVISEISKLRMVTGIVTKSLVEKLIPRPLEDNTFNMVDYLLNGEIDKATQLYKDLKLQNIDVEILMASLGTQFRFLYQVKHLNSKGYSNDEIASELNNIKPGRVYYALKKIGYHGEEEILNILNDLSNLHESIRNGLVDRNIGFELFLIKEK